MARKLPPRGKVTRKQERCLQMTKEFLTEELDSTEIVPKLITKLILNRRDQEHILGRSSNKHTRVEQNGRLVDKLIMRGPEGFEAFVQALDDTGHAKAYKRLCDTMKKLNTTTGRQEDVHQEHREGRNTGNDHNSEQDSDAESPRRSPHDSVYNDDDVRNLSNRVDHLYSNVDKQYKETQLLNIRVTKLDGKRQKEIQHLEEELAKSHEKIEQLRKENIKLRGLVADNSEQLKVEGKKIAQLERHIQNMEIINESLVKQLNDHKKRTERLQAQKRHTDAKVNNLEKKLEDQEQEQDQQRKDIDQLWTQLEDEKAKWERTAKSLNKKLEQQKKEQDAAMQEQQQMNEQRFQLLERTIQQSSAPIQQSSAPIQQSSAPIQQSSAPIQQSSTPIQQSSAPIQQSSTPLHESSAPIQQYDAKFSRSSPRYSDKPKSRPTDTSGRRYVKLPPISEHKQAPQKRK